MDISYKVYDEENIVLKINSQEDILKNVVNDVGAEFLGPG